MCLAPALVLPVLVRPTALDEPYRVTRLAYHIDSGAARSAPDSNPNPNPNPNRNLSPDLDPCIGDWLGWLPDLRRPRKDGRTAFRKGFIVKRGGCMALGGGAFVGVLGESVHVVGVAWKNRRDES